MESECVCSVSTSEKNVRNEASQTTNDGFLSRRGENLVEMKLLDHLRVAWRTVW